MDGGTAVNHPSGLLGCQVDKIFIIDKHELLNNISIVTVSTFVLPKLWAKPPDVSLLFAVVTSDVCILVGLPSALPSLL